MVVVTSVVRGAYIMRMVLLTIMAGVHVPWGAVCWGVG